MIRILVVDDHPTFRDAGADLLGTVPDMEIVGIAASAEQATAAATANPPDIVLMDVHLPGANGVEATRSVLALAPSTAVLALTMVDDDDMVLAAMAPGARGYLLKDATADEVIAAVRMVAAGGAVLGARIASRLLGQGAIEPRRGAPSAGAIVVPGEELTAREREVLEHLAKRANDRQIARELGVSLKTVQNHVSRILDKLQAADRTQAILRARGIDPPSWRRPPRRWPSGVKVCRMGPSCHVTRSPRPSRRPGVAVSLSQNCAPIRSTEWSYAAAARCWHSSTMTCPYWFVSSAMSSRLAREAASRCRRIDTQTADPIRSPHLLPSTHRPCCMKPGVRFQGGSSSGAACLVGSSRHAGVASRPVLTRQSSTIRVRRHLGDITVRA